MRIKVGDLTLRQLHDICNQHRICEDCPLRGMGFADEGECRLYLSSGSDDEEIELSEETSMEKAKRILVECGILTEDGEIVKAYKDIIVKKERKQ